MLSDPGSVNKLYLSPKFANFAFHYKKGVSHYISNLRGSITSTTVYGLLVSLLTLNS